MKRRNRNGKCCSLLCCIVICYNYTHIHAEYILTQWIKTSDTVLRKIYLSLYLKGCVWEKELETEQKSNILTPTLMAISVVSFSFSRASQPGAWGPSLSGTCSHPSIFSPTGLQTHWGSRGPLLPHGGFLYNILSLTHLISNSLLLNRGPGGPFCWVLAFSTASCLQLTDSPTPWFPVFTELYNSSIAHSVFGMACLIVITVMQFTGHSLPVHQSMSVPWDFNLSHFFS